MRHALGDAARGLRFRRRRRGRIGRLGGDLGRLGLRDRRERRQGRQGRQLGWRIGRSLGDLRRGRRRHRRLDLRRNGRGRGGQDAGRQLAVAQRLEGFQLLGAPVGIPVGRCDVTRQIGRLVLAVDHQGRQGGAGFEQEQDQERQHEEQEQPAPERRPPALPRRAADGKRAQVGGAGHSGRRRRNEDRHPALRLESPEHQNRVLPHQIDAVGTGVGRRAGEHVPEELGAAVALLQALRQAPDAGEAARNRGFHGHPAFRRELAQGNHGAFIGAMPVDPGRVGAALRPGEKPRILGAEATFDHPDELRITVDDLLAADAERAPAGEMGGNDEESSVPCRPV